MVLTQIFLKEAHIEQLDDSRLRAGYATVNDFRSRQITHEEAFDGLVELTPPFQLMAGHIAVELAQQHTEQKNEFAAANWLDNAGALYRDVAVLSGSDTLTNQFMACTANLSQGQLELRRRLLLEHKLPNEELAKNVHQLTVDEGKKLREMLYATSRSRAAGSEHQTLHDDMVGAMSELIVSALAQRIALKELDPEDWFPFDSYISEDLSNHKYATVNSSWDQSIYTDLDGGPKLTYRVQVKSSNRGQQNMSDAEGISRIYVNPDLKLDYENQPAPILAGLIIAACKLEFDKDGYVPRVSEELDQRCSQLLDKIEYCL